MLLLSTTLLPATSIFLMLIYESEERYASAPRTIKIPHTKNAIFLMKVLRLLVLSSKSFGELRTSLFCMLTYDVLAAHVLTKHFWNLYRSVCLLIIFY